MVVRPSLQTLPFGTHRLYQSEVVCLGATRCPPGSAGLGPIRRHVFVFPCAPVWVDRAGEEPFLADVNRVLFHAEGDEVARRAVDGRGALGHWFAIDYDHLLPALDRGGRELEGRGPFRLRHAPCSGDVFRRQALLVRGVLDRPGEVLRIDETALRLMEDVLASAYGLRSELPGRSATLRRHARLVEEVLAWFGVHFRTGATLAQIAAAVGSSPFHLARVFRAHTGLTLHAYRNQLRLRAATQAVLDGEQDLARLALELGFASHSHMTDAFRVACGFPPSQLRSGGRQIGQGEQRQGWSS